MTEKIKSWLDKWRERLPHITCPHCGYRKLWKDSKYCSECGKRLDDGRRSLKGNNFDYVFVDEIETIKK